MNPYAPPKAELAARTSVVVSRHAAYAVAAFAQLRSMVYPEVFAATSKGGDMSSITWSTDALCFM